MAPAGRHLPGDALPKRARGRPLSDQRPGFFSRRESAGRRLSRWISEPVGAGSSRQLLAAAALVPFPQTPQSRPGSGLFTRRPWAAARQLGWAASAPQPARKPAQPCIGTHGTGAFRRLFTGWRLLFACSCQGELKLWAARDGWQLRQILDRPVGAGCAISPDGRRLAFAVEGGIGIWGVAAAAPTPPGPSSDPSPVAATVTVGKIAAATLAPAITPSPLPSRTFGQDLLAELAKRPGETLAGWIAAGVIVLGPGLAAGAMLLAGRSPRLAERSSRLLSNLLKLLRQEGGGVVAWLKGWLHGLQRHLLSEAVRRQARPEARDDGRAAGVPPEGPPAV
jgi:hypothetical protein